MPSGDVLARFAAAKDDPTALVAFAHAMPKGGDLHNHLSGAIYAETYLDWGAADGDCINTSTHAAVGKSQCGASTAAVPVDGPFFDEVVRAWSMQDFVPGAENGHDHFFATFGKYGAIAGTHRDDSLADLATRAADENQLYIETMFNLGKNVGSLASDVWTSTVTSDTLSAFYDKLLADPKFAGELSKDVAVVDGAASAYRNALGCNGASPPAACSVRIRFIAQVSRTGANDQIFGQLVAAFEMAKKTKTIVGANLSSPEDDTSSLKNYDLHMAMLAFLHDKYDGQSPLGVTLHAGELAKAYLPSGYDSAITYHVRAAVEIAKARRIGHGVDVLGETGSAEILDEMAANGVLVEVCLSSNAQILEVSGAAHPLAQYLQHGVPVALATDDQGVSRSSLAGEIVRAVSDQGIDYAGLKTMARNSLEHSFLPGASLWQTLGTAVDECSGIALGATPDDACTAYLAASERATVQWELEHRFSVFEAPQ